MKKVAFQKRISTTTSFLPKSAENAPVSVRRNGGVIMDQWGNAARKEPIIIGIDSLVSPGHETGGSYFDISINAKSSFAYIMHPALCNGVGQLKYHRNPATQRLHPDVTTAGNVIESQISCR